MTVTVDATRVSPSKVIRASAHFAPLSLVSGRMLIELSDELGGEDQAGRFLLSVAEEIGRPIGVNIPTAAETSQTIFLAPRAWSSGRLAGWVAGHHEAVEAMFGPATRVVEEDW